MSNAEHLRKERRGEWGEASLMICLDGLIGSILVVGGGPTGLRKIRTLLEARMQVRLISPEALPELAVLAADGRIAWEDRFVERNDFEEHAFALLALSPTETRKILPLAEGTCCRLNCCGAPELGTWSLAAQFRVSRPAEDLTPTGSTSEGRGDANSFLVGVASGGRSPAGSAALKKRLQKYLEGDIS